MLLRPTALCLVTFALASTGCDLFKGTRAGTGAGSDGEAWNIQPVAIRVYPTPRFVTEGDRLLLDLRIEFTDAAGDTTKGVGHFVIELYAAGRSDEPAVGRTLYRWDVALLTLAENKKHYDPITRTYHFRLHIDEPDVTRDPLLLHVAFTPHRAERLETEAMLEAVR
jgi:hypothetical protein